MIRESYGAGQPGEIPGEATTVLPEFTAPQTPETTILDLGLDVGYQVKWSREKCGRDLYQNFLDANHGSLDDVEIESAAIAPDMYELRVSDDAEYDYQRLMVIGNSSKPDAETAAGGFGEGAKILSLVLLRDHGAEGIVFQSGTWELEYFLKEFEDKHKAIPGEPRVGLHAKITTGLPYQEGNTVRIRTPDAGLITNLEQSQQLFRSSENPDFEGLMSTTIMHNGEDVEVGISFTGVEANPDAYNYTSIGREDYYFTRRSEEPQEAPNPLKLRYGHVYVAGQRRHSGYTDNDSDWKAFQGLTIAINKDTHRTDRDRGGVDPRMLDTVLAKFAESCTEAQVKQFLVDITPAYGLVSYRGFGGGFNAFFTEMINRAVESGIRLDGEGEIFAKDSLVRNNYVAFDTWQPDAKIIKGLIQAAGKTPIPKQFAELGAEDDTAFVKKLHEHLDIAPSPEQVLRIQLLSDIALELGTFTPFTARRIALFSQKGEKNPAHGSNTKDGNLWLSVEHLRTASFQNALSTVIHEYAHEKGAHTSDGFERELERLHNLKLARIIADPTIIERMKAAEQSWEESQARETPQAVTVEQTIPEIDLSIETGLTGLLKTLQGNEQHNRFKTRVLKQLYGIEVQSNAYKVQSD